MAQLYHFTFDANDFSEFDTAPTGTGLTTSVSAGLNGTAAGAERTQDAAGTNGDIVLSSLNDSAVTTVRIGFRLDLNTFSIGGAGANKLFDLVPSSFSRNLYFIVRDEGSGLLFEFEAEDDTLSGGGITQSGILSAGEITVEGATTQAATSVSSDGTATLYINSVQVDQATGLDNFDAFEALLDGFALFSLNGGSGNGSGTIYYDEIFIRDDNLAVFVFSGYDLVAGGGQP